jgi:hypothetical protein
MSLPSLNPSLSLLCQLAVSLLYKPVTDSCGGANAIQLISSQDAVSSLASAGSNPDFLASFCSTGCTAAVDKFVQQVTPTCGDQALFAGSDKSASALGQTIKNDTSLICFADGGLYCLSNVIYPALASSGFDPLKSETLTTALISFATDKSKACTPCASMLVNMFTTNAGLFGDRSSDLKAVAMIVNTTCTVKVPDASATTKENASGRSGLAGVALMAVAFVLLLN